MCYGFFTLNIEADAKKTASTENRKEKREVVKRFCDLNPVGKKSGLTLPAVIGILSLKAPTFDPLYLHYKLLSSRRLWRESSSFGEILRAI